MTFEPPLTWRPDFTACLFRQGRFQGVTIQAFKDIGLKYLNTVEGGGGAVREKERVWRGHEVEGVRAGGGEGGGKFFDVSKSILLHKSERETDIRVRQRRDVDTVSERGLRVSIQQ